MGKYRSKLQIIADMLFIAREGAKKTWIMYQANLSYKLFCRYLKEVIKGELITFEKEDGYVLTPKGEEFLTRFDEYNKQCRQLEEQISSVQGERQKLEQMLFNEAVDIDYSSTQADGRNLKARHSASEAP